VVCFDQFINFNLFHIVVVSNWLLVLCLRGICLLVWTFRVDSDFTH